MVVAYVLRTLWRLMCWWLVGLCGIITTAASASQVLNPYFTGTLTTATNWTVSITTYGNGFDSALSAGAPTAVSSGGSTEFLGGCVGVACLTYPQSSGVTSGAQQTVPTVTGQNYAISFWTYFTTANSTAVEIDVYWGSPKIYAGTNVAATGWSQHTISLGVAPSTSNVLTVMIRDDPSYSAITAIDIEPVTLNVTKTSAVICDPINANSPPRSIPGAAIQYAITIANTGGAATTLTTITDTLPSNVTFDTHLNSGAGTCEQLCIDEHLKCALRHRLCDA